MRRISIVAVLAVSVCAEPVANPVPVLTVCEALRARAQYNGQTVVVIGRMTSTDEGNWLRGDCTEKLITGGYTWPDIIWISFAPGESNPPRPSEPKFWNSSAIKRKLKQARAGRPANSNTNSLDEWFAVFGRFETRNPLGTVQVGDGRLVGYGFGHMNAAPAELIGAIDNRLK